MIQLFRSVLLPQILKASCEAFEWIARAGILLDDVPQTPRAIGSGDNAIPIKISVPDLCEEGFPVGAASVVFDMEQRQPALEPFTPGDRIASAGLDPVSIDLRLEMACA